MASQPQRAVSVLRKQDVISCRYAALQLPDQPANAAVLQVEYNHPIQSVRMGWPAQLRDPTIGKVAKKTLPLRCRCFY